MEIADDGGEEFTAAPFVAKTYQMVSDPANGAIIAWGKKKNSFVVFDPFTFSQTLLPSVFKHSNFSSFVRQLNTYGFRKVDPDRWEFAHASFLRGQKQLLRRIVRKRKGRAEDLEMAEEDEALAMEVVGLKQEQRAIEDRLERMWRRVREAEKRPRQMLGFLVRVFEDPEMLVRLRARVGRVEQGESIGWEKRTRLHLDGDTPPAMAPPPPATSGCFGIGPGVFCGGGTGGLGSDVGIGIGGGAWGFDPFPVDNGF